MASTQVFGEEFGFNKKGRAVGLYEGLGFVKVPGYRHRLGDWLYMRKEL